MGVNIFAFKSRDLIAEGGSAAIAEQSRGVGIGVALYHLDEREQQLSAFISSRMKRR